MRTLFLLSFFLYVDAWIWYRHTRSLRDGHPKVHSSPYVHTSGEEIETIHGSWNASRFGAANTWGRRPVILRKAFPSTEMSHSRLPSWQEILELACCASNEDDQDMVESLTCRLIQHCPDQLGSFTLEFGPFDDTNELDKLLKRNDDTRASTLVVNDVDRWIPDVSDWMDVHFDFLPRWRRDDAQVSLAARGGGIGPHVDNYDVFLVQTSGYREWEICLEPICVQEEFDNLVEASQVRILNSTRMALKTIKVPLGPGDCLYLPPRFVHCGTATSDDCVTLSVGCRAPSAADLLSKVAESLADSARVSAVRRYSDEALFLSSSRGLTQDVKDQMKELLLDLVRDIVEDDTAWNNLVGKLITSPNRPVFDYPTPLYDMDPEWKLGLGLWGCADKALEAILAGHGELRRAEGVSFAWSISASSPTLSGTLYAQGRVFYLRGEESPLWVEMILDRIANGLPINQAWLNGNAPQGRIPAPTRNFLLELLNEGFLYGDEVS